MQYVDYLLDQTLVLSNWTGQILDHDPCTHAIPIQKRAGIGPILPPSVQWQFWTSFELWLYHFEQSLSYINLEN